MPALSRTMGKAKGNDFPGFKMLQLEGEKLARMIFEIVDPQRMQPLFERDKALPRPWTVGAIIIHDQTIMKKNSRAVIRA